MAARRCGGWGNRGGWRPSGAGAAWQGRWLSAAVRWGYAGGAARFSARRVGLPALGDGSSTGEAEVADAVECQVSLESNRLASLACAKGGIPYVVPIYYAYEDQLIYSFSMLGKKVDGSREPVGVSSRGDPR